jgi:preprotein translocase subunit YajC
MLLMLVAFLPVFFILWFSGRSQQKKQRELESKLKKGDRVVTQSGLIGKLVDPPDGRQVRVEIAPGVKVQMLKTAIVGLDTEAPATGKAKDEAPAPEKK